MLRSPLAVILAVLGGVGMLAGLGLAFMAAPSTSYPYTPLNLPLMQAAGAAAIAGLLIIAFGKALDLLGEIRDAVEDPALGRKRAAERRGRPEEPAAPAEPELRVR